MNLRHRSGGCAFAFAFALLLVSSATHAAAPCTSASMSTQPSVERGDHWAQVARALPAPRFDGPGSRTAQQAFAGRYHRWRARRLALLAGASAEWLVVAGVAQPRPVVRCFAERAERAGTFPFEAFGGSNASWELLLDLGSVPDAALDIATWARLGRALTDLVSEERRADESWWGRLTPLERRNAWQFHGSLGPYNEVEASLARKALLACVRQSTLRQTWTRDSEECEQLMGRVFRGWFNSALDELREPPSYIDAEAPGRPVALTPRALAPARSRPPR